MIYQLDGRRPVIDPGCFVAPNAAVIGSVTVHAEASIWFSVTVRADNDAIVMKTRCPAITGGVYRQPGEDLANILKAWLEGEPAPEKPKTEHGGDETLKVTQLPRGCH